MTVNLTIGAATGTSGVSNIQTILGGAGNDSLIGDNNANTLRGGLGNDLLDGRGGVDLLDESNASVDLTIDLSDTGIQTTGLGDDQIWNIENVSTGSGNDDITGNGSDNILSGGSGADTYHFADNWGIDQIIETEADANRIDFSLVTADLTISLADTGSVTSGLYTFSFTTSLFTEFTAGSGNDNFTLDGSLAIDLNGGAGADEFSFNDGATLSGSIDGSAGSDSLNLSAYSDGLSFTLTDAGSVDGYQGEIASGLDAILSGFDNIDALVGSATTDDELNGLDVDATGSWAKAVISTKARTARCCIHWTSAVSSS